MTPLSFRPRSRSRIQPGEVALGLGGDQLRLLLSRIQLHQDVAGADHCAGLEVILTTMPGCPRSR